MPEKTPASSDVLNKHYRNLADEYDEFLHYSDDFVRTLTAKMIDHLDLGEEDRLADIGCGTGIYSLDILEQVDLKQPILGVDPYPEMLAAIPDEANIEPIATTALEFSREGRAYDKVLIKEGIHHVREREEFFANVYATLPDDGRMLLVHVPPDVDYPLFEAALERCLEWHADPDVLEEQLADTGFSVERDAIDIQHEIPTAHYLRMVENCYMSVLTSFEEEELEAGFEEMRARYGHLDMLRFVDHFDYLTAIKNRPAR
ncbi:MAG: class I SAM-dependent methyltransferase [Actinomycetota bacterium]